MMMASISVSTESFLRGHSYTPPSLPPTTSTGRYSYYYCFYDRRRPLPLYHDFLLSSPCRRRSVPLFLSKCSESAAGEGKDEWLSRLPEKNKPLYAHSLPCIEAWLKSLGFIQSNEDRAFWYVQKPDWHAQLSLDVTDLYIRYLKIGPGNLDKDVERRFSYALSREDIENAVLGGP